MEELKQNAAERISTAGSIGWFPFAQGTAASFFSAIFWWIFLAGKNRFSQFWIILFTTLIGIWSSGRAERTFGKDASPIVIDEVVGQWIALFGCPRKFWTVIFAFLTFRFFDIFKPGQIEKVQDLRGGKGVMLDDTLAGIYTLLIVQTLNWIKRVGTKN